LGEFIGVAAIITDGERTSSASYYMAMNAEFLRYKCFMRKYFDDYFDELSSFGRVTWDQFCLTELCDTCERLSSAMFSAMLTDRDIRRGIASSQQFDTTCSEFQKEIVGN